MYNFWIFSKKKSLETKGKNIQEDFQAGECVENLWELIKKDLLKDAEKTCGWPKGPPHVTK